MVYVAPYVALMSPDSRFTDLVFGQGFGKHWGIFVHSRHSLKEMRRHFRSLVNVYDETGRSLIFRFYDPRVIRKFLPTCQGEQLQDFFGKIETYFAENETVDGLLSFQIKDKALKQDELK
jgi:hypothetical protein